MRRLLLLAPLLLLTVSGCGVLRSSEVEATDAARDVARSAGDRLRSQRPRTAEEVGYSASGIDGVEVLRVKGASTHDGDGVEVTVRTSGSAYNELFDPDPVTVRRCFAIRVSPKSEWREAPRDVDCPDGPRLTFSPPPEPPRLPYEELHAKLPRVPEGGRVDEAEVRRAVAALDLDAAIRTEVKADGDRVGVLLSVQGNGYDPQDCLLGHVRPGFTEVWMPSRVQRMRGEGGCTIGNALTPMPPPH
ncbi:translation initiation factor IF-2 [Streptomyces sp. MW-W600-10]|uniref:translation initiation factor IF-2 n=1 Tax=Streptomyces sp. MW-W600-10 TaxID=2829819 RepID=UPI001C496670|nr:translation initiation factor IF-2 [Streptomyces sp. MW-W600-10]MBV7244669.1 translation initiation factor IF-2 [Streptomyces sp. MW-W600-10]